MRNVVLDNERAARLQMCSDIGKAGNLFLLTGQVGDRVAHEVDEPEGLVDGETGEIAGGDDDGVRDRFGTQPFDHCWRDLDTIYICSSFAEWQSDTARADAHFYDGATPDQLGE